MLDNQLHMGLDAQKVAMLQGHQNALLRYVGTPIEQGVPIKGKYGQLLFQRTRGWVGWVEHFQETLNQPDLVDVFKEALHLALA